MHNKLFVVDGVATIVGGRNIGGHYFEAHEASNFTDLDVLLLGPVARDAEECFERYWSSDLAVPLPTALGKRDAHMARERIERYVRAARFTRLQELYRTQHDGLRDTLERGDHTRALGAHATARRRSAQGVRAPSSRRAADHARRAEGDLGARARGSAGRHGLFRAGSQRLGRPDPDAATRRARARS